jgi:hypothetical protein
LAISDIWPEIASTIWHHRDHDQVSRIRMGGLGRLDRPLAAVPAGWADVGVGLAALAGLAWGWHTRADPALDPHGWTGWWLGLVAALLMAAVGGFSWRKRVAAGHGSVAWWYNVHILCGLAGVDLALIHARFAWGAINSNFATVACVLVVISGLVARYALAPARRSGNRVIMALADSWHYAHLPLFLVLVLAVLLHVYMAHAY